MRLVKVEDGLLEHINYFINTPMEDFFGDFIFSRTSDTFTIKSGYIERMFPHNEYVIVIEKEPIVLDDGDSYKFYTRKGSQVSGLIEDKEELPPATHWKLIRHKGFIQGYRSNDGINWDNRGGGELKDLTEIQGFSIEGSKELKLKSYQVYRSPYIRFYNFEPGTKAIVYDNEKNILIEKTADEDDLIEIYLENPISANIKFYDKNSIFILETSYMNFKYGDTFFYYQHDIEFYYKGVVLDYNPKKLNTRHELVEMENLSPIKTYELLKLTIINDTVDTIKISLDDKNFYNELIVPDISPNEKIPIFIKIDKNPNYPSYGMRKFTLEVDDGTGFLGGSCLSSMDFTKEEF